jgi:hypothetical protein
VQHTLMIVLSLHILAAVFWAGSTFALARMDGSGSERLFGPQMGAATVVILTGASLWRVLHKGSFGAMEQFLSVGALCALVAVAVQAIVAGGALRKLLRGGTDGAAVRLRIVIAHRIAAVLLAVATVSMAAARYA